MERGYITAKTHKEAGWGRTDFQELDLQLIQSHGGFIETFSTQKPMYYIRLLHRVI